MHISFTKNGSKTKPKDKSRIKGDIKRFLPGVIAGVILTIAALFAMSYLYLKLNRPDKILFYAVYVLIALAAFLGGYICQKRVKGRGITVGAICAVPLTVLTAIFIFALGGEKTAAIFLIVPLIQLIASSLGGITAANQKKRY